ncbi:MAG: hypothetical protein F6K21_29110, partial [Symploca sp. SIO2D2]|nr:hypothetical protein [Symploca sp. SIO2D2]
GVLEVSIPEGVSGSFTIIVEVDAADQIQETVGSPAANNLGTSQSVAIALKPYADLTVTEVIAQELVVGDPVDLTVTWTVENQGTGQGEVDTWTDRVYLSRDGVLGNDILIGEFVRTGFVPVGASYTATEIIQLAAATEGRFTLFVVTDASDEVFEHTDIADNVGSPDHPVDVSRIPYADLIVETVDVVAADPLLGFQNGAPVQISWIVTNDTANGIGATDVSSWNDRIFISTSPEGTSRRAIGSLTHLGALGSGESYTASTEVILPIDLVGGEYYIFVETGGPFEFIYTDNNSGRADAINLNFVAPPAGDLEVESVSGPTESLDSDQIEVTWTVRNVDSEGDAVTGTWLDSVYLVENDDISTAVLVASFRQALELDAGLSYTRTELVRLPTHLVGSYQLLVRTDRLGEVVEDDETNNDGLSSESLTISLRPRPNLQVTTLDIPVEVTSGGVIDVEFTVTNNGPAATPTGGSRWVDYVYLSNNNQPGGVFLGSLQNGSALAPGESYTTRATFQIERAAAGEFFIVVVADGARRVDEFQGEVADAANLGENDNSRASPLFVDVTPVPSPDLVVQTVETPLASFDGNEITVRYRVANLGAGATIPGNWSDSVWLVTSPDRRPGQFGDIYLGAFGHNGALDVGEFYENEVNVNIPLLAEGGLYYLTVWTDSSDRVFELAFDENLNPALPNDLESSNIRSNPITIIPTPPADLEVTSVVAPDSAQGGEVVTLTYTVTNSGSAKTDVDRWADIIYISESGSLNDATRVFGVPHFGALEVGQSYTETVSFTLPPSATGSHFIVETNADPRQLLTNSETLLEQIAGIVQRAEDAFGKPLAEVRGVDLQDFSRNDILKILTGDGEPGPRLVFERGLTSNNYNSTESVITDIPADLIVSSVTVPDFSFSGEEIEVEWTVVNQGGFAVWEGTQRWTDYIYISPDPVFDASRATLVGSRVHVQTEPLGPSDSYTASALVNVPQGIEGNRYVHVFTAVTVGRFGPNLGETRGTGYPDWPEFFESYVWESPDRSNNFASSGPIDVVYREADLRVSDFSVDPTSIASGGFAEVTFTVTNFGGRETRVDAWQDRVFISTDETLDLYDLDVGSFLRRGVLAPGESYTVSGEIRLPDGISGDFKLIVVADSPFNGFFGNNAGLTYPEARGRLASEAAATAWFWNSAMSSTILRSLICK